MSKAEEIAEAKLENGRARKKLWQAYLQEDEMAFIEAISEVEDTHTNATLDTLKEKAWEVFDEKDINNNGYLVGYNKAVNDFSKLIDEVRNE